MNEDTTMLEPLTTEYAAIIAEWLQGEQGRETLRLLGNILPPDFTTDEAAERKRTEEILADANKIAWIILFDDEPVGVAEVNLKATKEIQAPHFAYFIGEKNSRANGIGTAALFIVLDELSARGYKQVFGRALQENIASKKVMLKAGFVSQGDEYTDKDGLIWQNFVATL
jgi:RimJ/RimL family protein N-acetyltransferase